MYSNIRGLEPEEYENTRLASTGMSILVSKMSPIFKDSRTCRNAVLTKTLVVPIIDLPTKTSYWIANNGHLHNENGKSGTYGVLSADSMIGKKTNIFGESMQVVGRSCEIDNSVETTTSPTGNFLAEKFVMKFDGKISIVKLVSPARGKCQKHGLSRGNCQSFYQSHVQSPPH